MHPNFTDKSKKVILEGRQAQQRMIPLQAMNSLQQSAYQRYCSTLLENQRADAMKTLIENQRADAVKVHLTEKLKETMQRQQNSPKRLEAKNNSPPPLMLSSASQCQKDKNFIKHKTSPQTIRLKISQEIYETLETPPPQDNQNPNSLDQRYYKKQPDLNGQMQNKTTPPPKGGGLVLMLPTIQQKAQELYNNLQTPPPQENQRQSPYKDPHIHNKTTPPPRQTNAANHMQTIHQKTQELYKNHETPPPQDNHHQLTYQNQQDHYRKTTPPLNGSDISNHTQTIHQRTQELYKTLQTPPPQDKQHQNPLLRKICQTQQDLGRKIPNKTTTSPEGVANHMQTIHQKTQELYKNLRTPPPQDNQHLNPPILEHYREEQEFDRKIQSKGTPPPPKETSFNSSLIPPIHLKTPEVYKNPLIPEDSKKPNPRYVRHNSVRDIHQELYKNHQTNPYPPPCTKSIHQRTQDIYSNLQTSPPPPKTTPPLNSQMIQQKTHDIYKNLQTPPPPHETKSLNHPTYNQIRKQQEHQEMNNQEADTTNSQKTGKNNTVKSFCSAHFDMIRLLLEKKFSLFMIITGLQYTTGAYLAPAILKNRLLKGV